MITDNIITFLTHRSWQISNDNGQFIELSPPGDFQLPQDFRIYVPKAIDKNDSKNFIENIFEIIGEFYSLTLDDLSVLIGKENSVLKVRIYDEQTLDGKIPLNRFEELVDKIRSILSDTASFVIDKSATSTRIPEEVARYLSLCNFMQTEKGSFVAKIQLPSKELIKDRELFDRNEIYSEEINQKLSEVLSFVNEEILEGQPVVTEEYIIENEDKINIKLLKDIETFFDKADLKNIDFTFHSINETKSVVTQNINGQKLSKLSDFVEKIESYSLEIGEFTFRGKIVSLKSKDPDGLKNSVTYTAIYNDMPIVVSANLSSDHYKAAIEAHKLKQYITITGQAKKTKSRARFTEITNFYIEQ